MDTQTVGPVRLASQSTASEVRDQTRARATASLAFFLGSVLGIKITESLAAELQKVHPKRLIVVAAGVGLWCRIRGAKPPADPIDHETVRWIFPEVRS